MPGSAQALTVAVVPAVDPAWASGRVAAAESRFDADGVLRTHVVLVDDGGVERARFAVPGGIVGGSCWVVDGVPAFVVGERVEVALVPARSGLTVADGEDSVVRLAPAADGRSGAMFADDAPTVTALTPDLGGATPLADIVVAVRGDRFGATQGDSRITFQGLFERVDAAVVSWSDTLVECRVPKPGLRGIPQVLSGTVKVWTAAGGWSDGDQFMNGPRFRVLYQWAGDRWPIAKLPLRVWLNPEGFPGGAGAGALIADLLAEWSPPGSYARLEYAGLTNAEAGPHDVAGGEAGDQRNTVRWRTTWPHPPQWLAVTWSRIDTLTYARREVDVEMNGQHYRWATGDETGVDEYDLPTTLLHEFGHWLRLGHTQLVTSVMRMTGVTGQQRRGISPADRFGASFIHPSYGTIEAPPTSAADGPLMLAIGARDREGDPRAGLSPERVRARLVPLFAGETPSPLDSMIVDGRKSSAVFADLPTDGDGFTTARFENVPGGRYRIEVTVDGQLVRPAPEVQVGDPAVAPAPVVALAGVVPQPLGGGVRGSVRFSLRTSTHVALDLYDVRGSRVRRVAEGRYAAGAHALPLWTRDEGGTTMTPGVYFLRMTPISGDTFAPLTARVVVLP